MVWAQFGHNRIPVPSWLPAPILLVLVEFLLTVRGPAGRFHPRTLHGPHGDARKKLRIAVYIGPLPISGLTFAITALGGPGNDVLVGTPGNVKLFGGPETTY